MTTLIQSGSVETSVWHPGGIQFLWHLCGIQVASRSLVVSRWHQGGIPGGNPVEESSDILNRHVFCITVISSAASLD